MLAYSTNKRMVSMSPGSDAQRARGKSMGKNKRKHQIYLRLSLP
jgi:hypothetical protein